MLSNEIITICVKKKKRNRYVIPVAFILWTRREWANGGNGGCTRSQTKMGCNSLRCLSSWAKALVCIN